MEITPPSDLEICLSIDFAPLGPRDCPRASPSGNLSGLGVQNPRPWEISWASGGVFSNTSLLSAVYGFNTNGSDYPPQMNKILQLDACRVADVARACERRSPKGQGLLRKEGPPTYAILSRNLVLSRFTRFLKGFHRVFNESHPAFIKLTIRAILLSKSFQQKPSCFRRAFNKSHLAFVELSTKAILLS